MRWCLQREWGKLSFFWSLAGCGLRVALVAQLPRHSFVISSAALCAAVRGSMFSHPCGVRCGSHGSASDCPSVIAVVSLHCDCSTFVGLFPIIGSNVIIFITVPLLSGKFEKWHSTGTQVSFAGPYVKSDLGPSHPPAVLTGVGMRALCLHPRRYPSHGTTDWVSLSCVRTSQTRADAAGGEYTVAGVVHHGAAALVPIPEHGYRGVDVRATSRLETAAHTMRPLRSVRTKLSLYSVLFGVAALLSARNTRDGLCRIALADRLPSG